MRVEGLEPPRQRRQILSLVRLPIPPYARKKSETYRIRTYDPLIKSQMLYQLS
jgi:hypothetical protein